MVQDKNILSRLQRIREESINKCYQGDNAAVQELRLEQLNMQAKLLKGGSLYRTNR